MDFLDLVNKRRTIRKYKREAIDQEVLEGLMEVVKKSPTGMDAQLRRYFVISDQAVIHSLANVMGQELGRADYDFYNPASLVLVVGPKNERNLPFDTAIAQTFLHLAATNAGLAACWINQFRDMESPEYRREIEAMGVKEDEMVYAGMALGYPDEEPEEKLRTEEVIYI